MEKELTTEQEQRLESTGIKDCYLSIHPELCELDGYFTAAQLRVIADVMDEMKRHV